MENSWKESVIEGWGRFVVMRKLKAFKERLKCRNIEVFGDIRVKKGEIFWGIEELDKAEESRSLSAEEINRRSRLRVKLDELLLREDVR